MELERELAPLVAQIDDKYPVPDRNRYSERVFVYQRHAELLVRELRLLLQKDENFLSQLGMQKIAARDEDGDVIEAWVFAI